MQNVSVCVPINMKLLFICNHNNSFTKLYLCFLLLTILMELLQLAVVTFLLCLALEVQLKSARYCDHQAEVYGHLLTTVMSQSIYLCIKKSCI